MKEKKTNKLTKMLLLSVTATQPFLSVLYKKIYLKTSLYKKKVINIFNNLNVLTTINNNSYRIN